MGDNSSIRIKQPLRNDVLSGRGGLSNQHAGNRNFRRWVKERKDKYSKAGKKHKPQIAEEVVKLVHSQNPPGRFIKRDPDCPYGLWWIELDNSKAMAKTSQALREASCNLRATHKVETNKSVEKSQKKRKRASSKEKEPVRSISSSILIPAARAMNVPPLSKHGMIIAPTNRKTSNPTPIVHATKLSSAATDEALRTLKRNVEQAKRSKAFPTVAPPLMSNKAFDQLYGKRNNTNSTQTFSPYATTPPLVSHPATSKKAPIPLKLPPNTSKTLSDPKELVRSNSLALSDFSNDNVDLTEDFVDPFADESGIGALVAAKTFTPPKTTVTEVAEAVAVATTTTNNPKNLPRPPNNTEMKATTGITIVNPSPHIVNPSPYDTLEFAEGMKTMSQEQRLDPSSLLTPFQFRKNFIMPRASPTASPIRSKH